MTKSLYALPAALLLAALAILAACGGDDDGDGAASPTETDVAASETAAATDTPQPTAANVTPRPLTGRECEPAPEAGLGLISYVEFDHSNSSYGPGEPVEMNLFLRNCASNTVRLTYQTAAQYDFFVEDLDGNEYWRWTDTQELGEGPAPEVTIAPEEIVEYAVTWGQTDRDGDAVEPGVYKIFAYSLGCGEETASDCYFGPVELIEIREA